MVNENPLARIVNEYLICVFPRQAVTILVGILKAAASPSTKSQDAEFLHSILIIDLNIIFAAISKSAETAKIYSSYSTTFSRNWFSNDCEFIENYQQQIWTITWLL